MNQEHLDEEQRRHLADVLKEFDNNIFSCVLKLFPAPPVEVQLKSNCHKPFYRKAFPVTNKDREFLKSQLDQLEDLQVLERIMFSEWAFSTFMVPKKNGTARFVSDFPPAQ